MSREYFCAYHSLIDSLTPYSDEERGRLFMAALRYSAEGIEPEFLGNERYIWATLKWMIDRDAEAYRMKCEKNRENGSRGGRPSNKAKGSKGLRKNRKDTNASEKSQEKEEEKEEEKEKDIKESSKEKKTRAKQFKPPTLEEVTAYCQERNSSVDPKTFYEFFEAGKWIDSKGSPVRNWKQKLLTWEAYNDKTKNQDQEKATSPGSFETEDFFEAALNRSYGSSGNEFVRHIKKTQRKETTDE